MHKIIRFRQKLEFLCRKRCPAPSPDAKQGCCPVALPCVVRTYSRRVRLTSHAWPLQQLRPTLSIRSADSSLFPVCFTVPLSSQPLHAAIQGCGCAGDRLFGRRRRQCRSWLSPYRQRESGGILFCRCCHCPGHGGCND